jgi:L-seryl-tRNA(Ser) seleniumtransferase
VDLVTFSGDKLLGGPQAGIILGRKDLVEAVKKNQLSRALRIDKLTLLALEETLTLYRDERAAVNEIPTLEMICQSYDGLDKKAQKLTEMLAGSETENYTLERIDGCSKIGGGALPLQELPTRLLCLTPKKISAQEMEGWLRSYDPPIIVRIETDQVLLDMRTIQERELKTVAQALKKLATA